MDPADGRRRSVNFEPGKHPRRGRKKIPGGDGGPFSLRGQSSSPVTLDRLCTRRDGGGTGRDFEQGQERDGTAHEPRDGSPVSSGPVSSVRVWSGPVTTERGPENGTGPKGPSSCPNVRSYGLAGVRLDLQICYAIPTQSGTRDGTSSGDWDKSLRPGRTPKVRTLSRKGDLTGPDNFLVGTSPGQTSDQAAFQSGRSYRDGTGSSNQDDHTPPGRAPLAAARGAPAAPGPGARPWA
jgi:hypothetical protein